MTLSAAKPLVSFIIPSYNTGKFILETLEHALAVDWPNKEIIVVDDGSTDGTSELVRPLSSKIRYIYQDNRGLSGARNTGIRNAHGEYCVFLDADDLVEPNYLQLQVSALESNHEAGISYSLWSYIDDRGELLPERSSYQKNGDLLKDLILYNRFPPVTAVVRKSVIEKIGGFDEAIHSGEDWDFWLRAAVTGIQFHCIPVPLVRYRIHTSNMSRNIKWSETIVGVLDKFFKTSGLGPEILALKPVAYSKSYLTHLSTLYRIGREEEALQLFLKAVDTYPYLLTEVDTYYSLICAHQPPGYRDTNFYKDMAEAETRINKLLDEVFACFKDQPEITRLRKQAVAVKEMTFARHEYQAGNNEQARAHILAAARVSFSAVRNREALSLLVRSFLGQDRVKKLKQWLKR